MKIGYGKSNDSSISISTENGVLGQTAVTVSSTSSRRTGTVGLNSQISSKPWFRKENPEQHVNILKTDCFDNEQLVITQFAKAVEIGGKIMITSGKNLEDDMKFIEFYSKEKNQQYLPLVRHIQLGRDNDAQDWLSNEENCEFLSKFPNVVSLEFNHISEIFDIPSGVCFESIQSLNLGNWLPNEFDSNVINDFAEKLLSAFPELYELTAFMRADHPLYPQNKEMHNWFIHVFSDISKRLENRQTA